jgi:hypothetical protein
MSVAIVFDATKSAAKPTSIFCPMMSPEAVRDNDRQAIEAGVPMVIAAFSAGVTPQGFVEGVVLFHSQVMRDHSRSGMCVTSAFATPICLLPIDIGHSLWAAFAPRTS